MSARFKSAGHAGTHCRHCVHAVTKRATLASVMVGRCTAPFSSAIVIKDQALTDADYVRFGHFWGRPLAFFIAAHRDAAFPELIRIDNDPATPAAMRDGAVHWHSDSSYEDEPAAVTMLYGKEAPDEGGVTGFANTAAAYDALSDAMKARIDGLVAVHELGRAPWIERETRPDPSRPRRDMAPVRHPLVIRHPVTGQPQSRPAFRIEPIFGHTPASL